jgi:hypothetical protein
MGQVLLQVLRLSSVSIFNQSSIPIHSPITDAIQFYKLTASLNNTLYKSYYCLMYLSNTQDATTNMSQYVAPELLLTCYSRRHLCRHSGKVIVTPRIPSISQSSIWSPCLCNSRNYVSPHGVTDLSSCYFLCFRYKYWALNHVLKHPHTLLLP